QNDDQVDSSFPRGMGDGESPAGAGRQEGLRVIGWLELAALLQSAANLILSDDPRLLSIFLTSALPRLIPAVWPHAVVSASYPGLRPLQPLEFSLRLQLGFNPNSS